MKPSSGEIWPPPPGRRAVDACPVAAVSADPEIEGDRRVDMKRAGPPSLPGTRGAACPSAVYPFPYPFSTPPRPLGLCRWAARSSDKPSRRPAFFDTGREAPCHQVSLLSLLIQLPPGSSYNPRTSAESCCSIDRQPRGARPANFHLARRRDMEIDAERRPARSTPSWCVKVRSRGVESRAEPA